MLSGKHKIDQNIHKLNKNLAKNNQAIPPISKLAMLSSIQSGTCAKAPSNIQTSTLFPIALSSINHNNFSSASTALRKDTRSIQTNSNPDTTSEKDGLYEIIRDKSKKMVYLNPLNGPH